MDYILLLNLFVYSYFIFSFVKGQSTEGDVRLRRGESGDGSGYVEIYHNNIWGRVCDTGWTHANAHVICKQLDYNGAQFPSKRPAQPANAALQVWLNNLACTGSEKQLSACGNVTVWLPAAPVTVCQTASVTCTPYLAQHLGCYNDDFTRALPDYANCKQEQRCNCDFTNSACLSTQMTVEFCKDICCNGQVKYAFYGVEAGSQCFCGASTARYTQHGRLQNADCHKQCTGNPAESCGADFKINVYGCNLGCEIPGRLSPNLLATPQLEVKLYNVGDRIAFSCLQGHTLNGAAQITCQAGGGWSGAVPTCQQPAAPTQPPVTTCTPPSGVTNLLYSPLKSTYLLGESVTFSCTTGFQLTGSKTLTCLGPRTWSGTLPSCQQISGCPALTGLDVNAVPSTLATSVGTTVTFTCKQGYVLLANTNPFKRCETSGWTGPNPVCQAVIPAVTCSKQQIAGIIPARSTYTPLKDKYVPGEIITIKCALGFKPKGADKVTCTNTGQWSQVGLQCIEIVCVPLPAYPNVIPSSTVVLFATSVSFRCANGYIMTTNQTPYRTCHTDGWVGPEPVCSAITCGVVPQYPNALASTTQATFGTRVMYTCQTGYQTIDRNLVTKTCQTTGKWDPPDIIQCQIINCGPLPAYTNAFPSTDKTVFGTIVTYSCHPGFSMTIIVSKQCTAGKTWTGPDPVCKPTVCAPLPQYPLAIPSTTSTAVATIVTFTCQTGALLTGSTPSKTCQVTGQWTGNDPKCIDINECASAPCKNGALCVNLLNKYVCNCSPGFSGTKCETDGGGTATGTATPCAAVPTYPQAIPSGASREVSSTITYTCVVGYQHAGNPPYKQCLPTGIWDGLSPQCLPVNCGRPQVPTHLTIGTAQDFTFSKTITYICTDRTKIPSPYATIKCESTKLWSRPPPPGCAIPAVTVAPLPVIDPKNPVPAMTTAKSSNQTKTVATGGINGNEVPTSKNSGGIPISIWIVILILVIAIALFILGFVLVRRSWMLTSGAYMRQHEEVRRQFGYPNKQPRKSRNQIPDGDGRLTAVAVTPSAPPGIIPIIKEPNDGDTDTITSSLDPNDNLDLRPQTILAMTYTESTPRDEYAYENEVEPEYTSSENGNSEDYSQTGSELTDTRSISFNGDGDSQIEGAIIAGTAAATETAPTTTKDGETGETKDTDENEKGKEEGDFIDGLIDNAKSKIDDCVIS